MDVDKGIAQKSMVFIWNENLQKGISSHWIVVCLLKKKELLYVWFCSVALNALFCLKKRKLRKNESEVFRVKIPQRKVTKCNTYNYSFFFIIVFLQFSIKFYFSGWLDLITNSKLVIFVRKRRGFSRRLWELTREKILHKIGVISHLIWFYTIK